MNVLLDKVLKRQQMKSKMCESPIRCFFPSDKPIQNTSINGIVNKILNLGIFIYICFQKYRGATHCKMAMEIKQTLKTVVKIETGIKLNATTLNWKWMKLLKLSLPLKVILEKLCEFFHYLNNMFSTLWLEYYEWSSWE